MKFSPPDFRRRSSAFTMVEIAICLAIIGIALVGIIGILPYGMNSQRDTREETIINQDVSMLLPAITQGLHGLDDLTNYVYAITNYQTLFNNDGSVSTTFNTYGYTYTSSVLNGSPIGLLLTNGQNIIGVLSTPEYANSVTYQALPNVINGGYSNHIVAYVHSLSGLASEKPPQDNPLMAADAFTYRLLVVNAPVALDTNYYNTPYNLQLWQNQHELRVTFISPLQPNGTVGNNRQTYRATIAGQLGPTNINGQTLYFYQPQFFNVNTN